MNVIHVRKAVAREQTFIQTKELMLRAHEALLRVIFPLEVSSSLWTRVDGAVSIWILPLPGKEENHALVLKRVLTFLSLFINPFAVTGETKGRAV